MVVYPHRMEHGPDPRPDGDQSDTAQIGADLLLLLTACEAALGARLLAAIRAAVDAEVRYSDGYVFQHLVPGPLPVTRLAQRLGVSQQAASKQVADLERRRLVARTVDPDDRRSRPVELTDVGWKAVRTARTARHEIEQELVAALGPETVAGLRSGLSELSAHLGAAEEMGRRRLRPESAR